MGLTLTHMSLEKFVLEKNNLPVNFFQKAKLVTLPTSYQIYQREHPANAGGYFLTFHFEGGYFFTSLF